MTPIPDSEGGPGPDGAGPSSCSDDAAWAITQPAGQWVYAEGDLDAAAAVAFRTELETVLRAQPPPRRLDLRDLELLDGVAVAEVVNAIRAVVGEDGLEIEGAPQMLAHTLYKVGDLRDGRLQLRNPRQDEGTTAN